MTTREQLKEECHHAALGPEGGDGASGPRHDGPPVGVGVLGQPEEKSPVSLVPTDRAAGGGVERMDRPTPVVFIDPLEDLRLVVLDVQ